MPVLRKVFYESLIRLGADDWEQLEGMLLEAELGEIPPDDQEHVQRIWRMELPDGRLVRITELVILE